ncbi:glycoside hydrolase family 2 [Aerococcaceae bacterium INB8]|uniref:Glycoside hydrolase family 2 n=1 Tax=Ruoffia halotolerans TaxID=2748684 RepID=A0A839A3A3_9LACT|nr:glycoside hydrolase family 2 TIM barrel-domain containing protein [Ruoffia halotolerans]MBA5728432.1 glycoside hydrolase family 2 [Ruoffia halotolerans]
MRNNYPRPQFQREKWINLNGDWQIEFDYKNQGLSNKYFKQDVKFSENIEVPYVYQSKKSGLNHKKNCEVLWYKKTFTIEKLTDTTVMHFGAVDYIADVYVNEIHIGQHIGGHTSFKFDISHAIIEGENAVTVRVEDYTDREWIPRGKQYWNVQPESIWYTNTTGIWQTVWLEQINTIHVDSMKITPKLDDESVEIKPIFSELTEEMELEIIIEFKGELIVQTRSKILSTEQIFNFDVMSGKIMNKNAHGFGRTWSPEAPNLFDVTLKLFVENKLMDKVESYFGMRKIHIENDQIFLNNRPFYQKLILDQGYWPNTLMTAPEDKDFEKDIKLAKEMGFNGARKHQKVEDPLYYYYADKLGFVVWGESASPANYNTQMVPLVVNEWKEIIERDYNHPSIIAWTPANESWGISEVNYDKQQQDFLQTLYYFVKSLDQTRLVIVNDGWEMIKTDILGVHNYSHGNVDEIEKYQKYVNDISTTENLTTAMPAQRNIIVEGYEYKGQPLMLTEFGGISFNPDEVWDNAWGYTSANTKEAFLADYERVIDAIKKSQALRGYCYTQLTDVEQETNGLLTFDRRPKVDLNLIKEINEKI